jgi:glycerophosphoryl diester phosphodiesterase
MRDNSCLIIAHRGESFDAPENTLAAINLAWERGADAVEIDIHLTKDNHIVVIHDFNTRRLTGVSKNIKDQTLAELRKLDVGLWKNDNWKGEKIPTLSEVFETVPHGKKIIIEIKSDAAIIPFLKEKIEQSERSVNQVEFIGFDLKTMVQAKKEFPQHNVLWLLDLDYYWYRKIFRPSITKAIATAKAFQLDGLNVWAGSMLDKELISAVKNSALLLYCWTVNDVEKTKNLMDWGIDAITTDRAQWLKSKLKMVNNP